MRKGAEAARIDLKEDCVLQLISDGVWQNTSAKDKDGPCHA